MVFVNQSVSQLFCQPTGSLHFWLEKRCTLKLRSNEKKTLQMHFMKNNDEDICKPFWSTMNKKKAFFSTFIIMVLKASTEVCVQSMAKIWISYAVCFQVIAVKKQ